MPAIVGLVGSPRREQGLTHRLVSAALEGARRSGASTRIEYLADWELAPCEDCGAPCFTDGICIRSPDPGELSSLVNEADGLVLGAPVYVWQANALTHVFMDRYRIPGRASLARQPNGRPALAIAVAGGTGTGISGAIRSLQDFLCLWGYRALDPIGATRYNLEQAIAAAREAGAELGRQADEPVPFANLAELLAHYDGLQFACHDHLEELIWLAEQAAGLGREPEEVKRLCAEARRLQAADRRAAAEVAVHAFELARGEL
ncbi:MAG: flavodoxin family protein [Anaerolineae bacterium]|nr:flavodoxin family protein [Anaerolineae bacterium]